MPSVNSTTYTTGAAMSASDLGATRTPTQALGQEDFLKLLTVQMTQQDPMNPMEDTAFIAQMAQFTSLEQTNALVDEMGYLRADIQLQGANSLLGKDVTVMTEDEELITGKVDAINADASSVYVSVNGINYLYGQVIGVNASDTGTTTG